MRLSTTTGIRKPATEALFATAGGLMFHHFHGGDHPPGQGTLSDADLERLLDEVAQRVRLLPAGEWLERALSQRLTPGDWCLTFDDNLRSQYDVALPVLEQRGLTAFWFVSTSVLQGHLCRTTLYQRFVQRCFRDADAFYDAFFAAIQQSAARQAVDDALRSFDACAYLPAFSFYTPADRRFRFVRDEVLGPDAYRRIMDDLIRATGRTLSELAAGVWLEAAHLLRLHERGHVVGLHSHTHPTRIAELSAAAQQREYAANLACLESLLGQAPITVSHPCNSYSDRTLTLLRRLGIRVGFRADMTLREHSPLEHPRQDCTNLRRAAQTD